MHLVHIFERWSKLKHQKRYTTKSHRILRKYNVFKAHFHSRLLQSPIYTSMMNSGSFHFNLYYTKRATHNSTHIRNNAKILKRKKRGTSPREPRNVDMSKVKTDARSLPARSKVVESRKPRDGNGVALSPALSSATPTRRARASYSRPRPRREFACSNVIN